jgi:hypothetical protein
MRDTVERFTPASSATSLILAIPSTQFEALRASPIKSDCQQLER